MTELPLDTQLQMTWAAPKSKKGCRRDPAAGPGTCYHWWEGCPDAAVRGCYMIWARAHAAAGSKYIAPGFAAPGDAIEAAP